MTQKSVEILIGKLASDEELRAAFRGDPLTTLRSMSERGLSLTPLEVEALSTLDPAALETLVRGLDPRLQKSSLRSPLQNQEDEA